MLPVRADRPRSLQRRKTWFLARCFHQLADAGLRGVVSFADPVLRRAANGQVVCPGHVGTIYQATAGAVYLGRSTPRQVIVLPDGTTLAARSAQKVRRQERGHDYVERRLVALGAPVPRAGTDPAVWLHDALDAVGAVRQRHGGCHRYAFALGRTTRERRSVDIAGQRGRYPKRDGP